jgi:hypothetical protein
LAGLLLPALTRLLLLLPRLLRATALLLARLALAAALLLAGILLVRIVHNRSCYISFISLPASDENYDIATFYSNYFVGG